MKEMDHLVGSCLGQPSDGEPESLLLLLRPHAGVELVVLVEELGEVRVLWVYGGGQGEGHLEQRLVAIDPLEVG